MDADRIAIARTCLNGADDGSLSFPQIVGTLIGAGFDGYLVDYRRNTASYYLPDGDSADLPMPAHGPAVAATFSAETVAEAVREAQAGGPGYSYAGFTAKVKAAGCAGYLVSFPGRRVLYFGRTGETHVEHFPG
jgi:uncharacterized protein YbcV (DUF1398 family)